MNLDPFMNLANLVNVTTLDWKTERELDISSIAESKNQLKVSRSQGPDQTWFDSLF